MDDDIKITNNNLCLFVPISKPSVEIQLMFKEITQINYEVS